VWRKGGCGCGGRECGEGGEGNLCAECLNRTLARLGELRETCLGLDRLLPQHGFLEVSKKF